jgi:hypothetical protein
MRDRVQDKQWHSAGDVMRVVYIWNKRNNKTDCSKYLTLVIKGILWRIKPLVVKNTIKCVRE